MQSSWPSHRSGEEETLEAVSSRTTPRPSFSLPNDTTQGQRASTDKLKRGGFPFPYSTPHDAVLSELQGLAPRSGNEPSRPASIKDAHIASPEVDSTQVVREDKSTSPALQQPPSRPISSDILLDPFDGSSLGSLVPHGQGTIGGLHGGDSRSPSQINLLGNTEAATNLNPSGSEAIWSHLSRVLDLQSDISKMHLQMESIGHTKPGDWKGKRPRRPANTTTETSTLSPDDSPAAPPGLRRPRARAMSTVSTISSNEADGDEAEGDVAEEDEEKSRKRGEEFAKLASQFEGRKGAIQGIMTKLDELSKTLSEFHSLQTPNIEFPASRNNSAGATSPHTGASPEASGDNVLKANRPQLSRASFPAGGRTYEWATQQNVAASSSLLTVQPPPFNRAKSDSAAIGVPILAAPQKRNVPAILVNSMDPELQPHVTESPASTIGSLKLPPEE